MTKIALTIAGSDSGGGAGVQADLKTFSALGVYGCSAITALTAQNTLGVQGVFGVPPAFLRRQIDSVFEDLPPDAVKIGMVGGAETIQALAEALDHWAPDAVVLDPVMVAKGGDRLLAEDGIDALRRLLMPRAGVITPNLPEAEALLGRGPISSRDDMVEAARDLEALGTPSVFLKGGHLAGAASPDLLSFAGDHFWLEGARVETKNTHGTGCTLSSALAAFIARGLPLPKAARAAKTWLAGALAQADDLAVGAGHGPTHHFHALWPHLERVEP